MDLIERLRAVKWEVTDDCGRMPDDPTHECVFVDMRPDDFRALLREAAAALEAVREDDWQPMETAPKDGTHVMLWIEWIDNRGIPIIGNFRLGRWFSSCCYGGNVASAKSMEPLYWRPLPAPPAIDRARGKAGQEVGS